MKRIFWELADASGLSFLSHEAARGQASYPSLVVEFIVPRSLLNADLDQWIDSAKNETGIAAE